MANATTTVDALNGLLADATVLYQKLRHYHWNVEGPHFFALHEKFEELYDGWAEHIDALAERILTIGGVPLHTLSAMLERASLEEDPEIPAAEVMVENIARDLATLRATLGSTITQAEEGGDEGTANLLNDIRDGVEKNLWMLRAWSRRGQEAWKE